MLTITAIILSLVLIGICAIFVAAEFSFVTVNRSRAQRLAAGGDVKASGVLLALKNLSTQLSGAQLGITITNLAIGFLAQPAIASLLYPPLYVLGLAPEVIAVIALMIALILATALTMIFGELVPKNLAIAKPLATARVVQGFQRGFTSIMHRPIHTLNATANFLLHKLGIEPQEELASGRSIEELAALVKRSAEKGTLDQGTALMLEKSLSFGGLRAEDIMTPRVRIQTVEAGSPVQTVIEKARSTGHSRFPVCGKDMDNIVGIVHIKQVVGIPYNQRPNVKIERAMGKPVLVPSSIHLDDLLVLLKKGGMHMAVVLDEYGGTDGIVTIEDVIEELVGDVRDEHDKAKAAVRKHKQRGWVLSGLLRPDEIAEATGFIFPENDEIETLGGLLADLLGRIPKIRDTASITVHDRNENKIEVVLVVEGMDGRRVDRIHLFKKGERPR